MKSLFRLLLGFVFAAAICGRGQSLDNYTWTNVVAFPGLPNLLNPVCIASPPGETNRVFICEHKGDIIVITNLAAPTRTVFMDISSRVGFDGEAGLCGLAFHPGFATNGYFYLFYTSRPNPGISDVLSRFKVSDTNANQGDTNSESQLFVQSDRALNHNAGDLHFGPDGYLYVAVGDEGNEHNTLHNAQYINSNLFSGILRIDVDKRPGSLAPNPGPPGLTIGDYAIPSDNPFVGATSFDGIAIDSAQVRTEFWAVGLRNPWRFSFDPLTGLLYCGDVGQDTVEEVDIITKGGNYGWASYEGNLTPPPGVTTNGQPVAQNAIAPIIQYLHGTGTNQGDSVIGGVVYRGTRFPELAGAYVFGDWSNSRMWASFYDGANATAPAWLQNASLPAAFGTDPRNGDVLYAEYSGGIKRLVSLTPTITSIAYSPTNIIVHGAGGIPGRTVELLGSTNISLPAADWTPQASSQVDALVNFSITNAADVNARQMFFQVVQ